MPKIIFQNNGQSYEVPEGTSVLECAVNNAIPLDHDCGGNCACTTCQIWIENGAENISRMSEDERGLLEANDKLDAKSRLGCQCRIERGEIVVRYPG